MERKHTIEIGSEKVNPKDLMDQQIIRGEISKKKNKRLNVLFLKDNGDYHKRTYYDIYNSSMSRGKIKVNPSFMGVRYSTSRSDIEKLVYSRDRYVYYLPSERQKRFLLVVGSKGEGGREIMFVDEDLNFYRIEVDYKKLSEIPGCGEIVFDGIMYFDNTVKFSDGDPYFIEFTRGMYICTDILVGPTNPTMKDGILELGSSGSYIGEKAGDRWPYNKRYDMMKTILTNHYSALYHYNKYGEYKDVFNILCYYPPGVFRLGDFFGENCKYTGSSEDKNRSLEYLNNQLKDIGVKDINPRMDHVIIVDGGCIRKNENCVKDTIFLPYLGKKEKSWVVRIDSEVEDGKYIAKDGKGVGYTVLSEYRIGLGTYVKCSILRGDIYGVINKSVSVPFLENVVEGIEDIFKMVCSVVGGKKNNSKDIEKYLNWNDRYRKYRAILYKYPQLLIYDKRNQINEIYDKCGSQGRHFYMCIKLESSVFTCFSEIQKSIDIKYVHDRENETITETYILGNIEVNMTREVGNEKVILNDELIKISKYDKIQSIYCSSCSVLLDNHKEYIKEEETKPQSIPSVRYNIPNPYYRKKKSQNSPALSKFTEYKPSSPVYKPSSPVYKPSSPVSSVYSFPDIPPPPDFLKPKGKLSPVRKDLVKVKKEDFDRKFPGRGSGGSVGGRGRSVKRERAGSWGFGGRKKIHGEGKKYVMYQDEYCVEFYDVNVGESKIYFVNVIYSPTSVMMDEWMHYKDKVVINGDISIGDRMIFDTKYFPRGGDIMNVRYDTDFEKVLKKMSYFVLKLMEKIC